jgi:hypothetical protein
VEQLQPQRPQTYLLACGCILHIVPAALAYENISEAFKGFYAQQKLTA